MAALISALVGKDFSPRSITRHAIRESCSYIYSNLRGILMERLRSAVSVSASFDGWTDLNQRHFICVTAHFVASDWTIESRAIAVVPLSGNGLWINLLAITPLFSDLDAKGQAKALRDVFSKWAILDKVNAMTSDTTGNCF